MSADDAIAEDSLGHCPVKLVTPEAAGCDLAHAIGVPVSGLNMWPAQKPLQVQLEPAERPREFDKAQALRRARDLLREHGYDGVSLADLTQELGLVRTHRCRLRLQGGPVPRGRCAVQR